MKKSQLRQIIKEEIDKKLNEEKLDPKIKKWLYNEIKIMLDGTDEAELFIMDNDSETDPEEWDEEHINMFRLTRDYIKGKGKINIRVAGNNGTVETNVEGDIIINLPFPEDY